MMTTTDEITGENITGTGQDRTWFRSDYTRFAAVLKRSRHEMHQPWQQKAQVHQDRVNELAGVIAYALGNDEHGGDFDAALFLEGTMAPGQATGMEPADAGPDELDGKYIS